MLASVAGHDGLPWRHPAGDPRTACRIPRTSAHRRTLIQRQHPAHQRRRDFIRQAEVLRDGAAAQNVSLEYGNANPINRSIQRNDTQSISSTPATATSATPPRPGGSPLVEDDLKLFANFGHPSVDGSNPAISGHRKSGHFRRPETGVEFYLTAPCVGKVVWTLVRQLRGPHFSTCA